MNGLTLDTGALIGIERRDRRALALIESTRRSGARVTVPTVVVIEWWRGQRGPLVHLLDAFDVEPLHRAIAELAGVALAHVRSGVPSAVDAVVMASAAQRGDNVLTGDIEDLDALKVMFPSVRILAL